jgi:hypothetical protein
MRSLEIFDHGVPMSFDARLFPSTETCSTERRSMVSPRALSGRVPFGVAAGAVLVSLACDSVRPSSETSPGARAGNAQSSTYKLEPPAPLPPASPSPPPSPSAETQLSALAVPGEAEKVAESDTLGSASPTCVNGWSAPPRGSVLRSAALNMMRGSSEQRFVIDEMRYFVGPEDAEVMSPQSEVERWYVKGYPEGDFQRRQRWLIRRARLGSGVDAVAPYESRGYGPKTWTRLDAPEQRLADPFQHPCDPAKPDTKCMGLPVQVLGCLDGT